MNNKRRMALVFLITVVSLVVLLGIQVTPKSHPIQEGKGYDLVVEQGVSRITFYYNTPKQLGVGVYWGVARPDIVTPFFLGPTPYPSIGGIQFSARTLPNSECPYLRIFERRLGLFFNTQWRCER